MDKNGKSVLIGKTYSQDSNINKVMKHVEILGITKPIRDYIVLHAQNPAGADIYTEKMFKLTGKLPVSIVDISPVIGMNAGVGAIAVSLMLE